MTTLLVDTSVLVKWFHSEGESELAEAQAIRDATRRDEVDACVIDLAIYEMGNLLLRGLRWNGSDVADQLDDLIVICGAPLAMAAAWFREAATIGAAHALTFYDACWVAAAQALGVSLVSADAQLLDAGLAESPRSAAQRLRLTPSP
ncbi:MAG: type II toxin-antitoxin system VapC family toxin [Candidatus Dormibacteria bacterium]